MTSGFFKVPNPENERPLSYEPESRERRLLVEELDRQLSNPVDIPMIIGGKEIRSEQTAEIRCPHNHTQLLGHYHKGTEKHAQMAITAALEAAQLWSLVPWHDRAAVFLRAAELISTTYRPVLNAATMLGQSKTVFQAEIDSACELIDFFRFNAAFMCQLYEQQPVAHAPGSWNTSTFRPLEGFVFAVTPFNFSAIAGNLPTSPAMMGNVVVWKPSSTAVLSSYSIMKVLKEAGLPDGVINFVPGPGSVIGDPVLNHPELAGLHFTGSTQTFRNMWKRIGENVGAGVYRNYPRVIGETGGKDFVIAAPDADIETLSVAMFRGAFEYQGQKCSAASRAYIPKSIWPEVRARLAQMVDTARVGDITDFRNFMGAIIDESSFRNLEAVLEDVRNSEDATIALGGQSDDSTGWFLSPTVIETTDPKHRTMTEEFFGPILTVFVYDDEKLEETLGLVDETSPYALTGAIFGKDRQRLHHMAKALERAAGNFYINDKPTGAVVGQQPFGGSRASGTNDKAGSVLHMARWANMRVIKENFATFDDYRYPHMA